MRQLSLHETRVIGALLEKELTTPDQYPLSLNALTAACNQKSNRDPVLALDEITVQEIVDDLVAAGLVTVSLSTSSRVSKLKHRFCNTEFSERQFNPQELAVICVMFLRGPQTPGELRTRTNRLCAFNNIDEVEATLKQLMNREGGPFIVLLPREPGKRESRYAHLFSGEVLVTEQVESGATLTKSPSDRIEALEKQVERLQREMDALKQELGVEGEF